MPGWARRDKLLDVNSQIISTTDILAQKKGNVSPIEVYLVQVVFDCVAYLSNAPLKKKKKRLLEMHNIFFFMICN